MERWVEDKYEQFYKILEDATIDTIKPNCLFAVSGGLDSRIVGGILAKNKHSLHAITHGTRLETIIATKVCAVLGFPIYSIPMKTPFSYLKRLKASGFEYLMTATFSDEINGSWSGTIATKEAQFHKFRDMAMNSQTKRTEVKNSVGIFPHIITPFSDAKLEQRLETIPFQYRRGKQIQQWILQTKFPELAKIFNYNSMLPTNLPYMVTASAVMFHYNLYIRHIKHYFVEDFHKACEKCYGTKLG